MKKGGRIYRSGIFLGWREHETTAPRNGPPGCFIEGRASQRARALSLVLKSQRKGTGDFHHHSFDLQNSPRFRWHSEILNCSASPMPSVCKGPIVPTVCGRRSEREALAQPIADVVLDELSEQRFLEWSFKHFVLLVQCHTKSLMYKEKGEACPVRVSDSLSLRLCKVSISEAVVLPQF